MADVEPVAGLTIDTVPWRSRADRIARVAPTLPCGAPVAVAPMKVAGGPGMTVAADINYALVPSAPSGKRLGRRARTRSGADA